MIKENWVFWLLISFLIIRIIRMVGYVVGMKTTFTWDATPDERLLNFLGTLIMIIVTIVALGWV